MDGILAVWGSPGSGKTVTAVKIAKHLAEKKQNVVLLLCDTIARTVVFPAELPIGIITALLGVPFFLYMLRSTGGSLRFH